MGGISKEREISLKTGSAISTSLRRLNYEVIDVDVGKDIVTKLESVKPDIAIVALHGQYGEDGCIQGLLEIMNIPYSGSGVLGSSVGMDKSVCKMVAGDLGLTLPKNIVYKKGDSKNNLKVDFGYPVVVKPSREGSTINVSIIHKESELESAVDVAFKSDNKILIEEYIKGVEVTVGVVNGKALTVLEVVPESGFYDFESKYTKGKTEYIVPARIDENVAKQIQNDALKIYNAVDCSGIARIDFIVADNNKNYFLEINTMPGMTELSLVPKAANHDGVTFDQLVEELVNSAGLKEKRA